MFVQTSSKDVQIRQLLLLEYRSKHKPAQALKNVKSKIGQCELTLQEVNFWFKRFDKRNTSLLKKKKNDIFDTPKTISNDKYLANERYKFPTVADSLLNKQLITNDGRLCFIIAFKEFRHPKILAVDSLNGDFKEMYKAGCLIGLDEHATRYFELIDNEQLLLYNYSKSHIYLLKFDANARKFEISSQFSTEFEFDCKFNSLLLNETDKKKFVLLNYDEIILTGSAENGNIVITRRIVSPNPLHIWDKLIGNKLHGFSLDAWLEVDVSGVDGPLIFEIASEFDTGKAFSLNHAAVPARFLHGNHLYMAFEYPVKLTKIFAHNILTKVWSNTNIIVMGRITGIHIDENATLTLKVCENEDFGTNCFYRFPLKKPEGLMNLAWIEIMRRSSIFGSTIFRNFASQLPYNCELRSLLSNE